MKVAIVISVGSKTQTILGDIDDNDIIRGVEFTPEELKQTRLGTGTETVLSPGQIIAINKDKVILTNFFKDPAKED
jgi:hypothetical protein